MVSENRATTLFLLPQHLPAIAFKALFGSEEFVAGSVQERIRTNRPEHRKAKVRDHFPFTVAGSVKLTESARIDLGKNAVRVAAVRRGVHDGISGINQRKAGILSLLVALANGPAVRNGVVEDNVHTNKIAVPGTGNKSLAVLLAFERHLGEGDADVMMKPLNLLLHTGKIGGNVNRHLSIILLSPDTPGADGSGTGRKHKARIGYSPGAQRCLAVLVASQTLFTRWYSMRAASSFLGWKPVERN